MKRIAVLTSGGDSPGMNAAVMEVARFSAKAGMQLIGIKHGYNGLIGKYPKVSDNWVVMSQDTVLDIADLPGTYLRTARCEEFYLPEYQKKAVAFLKQLNVEGLVVIGGDGSYAGAQKLCNLGMPCIGIPGTIDNDLEYSETSLGFDTAVNVCMEAVRAIRATSRSHDRPAVVEVMGRNSAAIALKVGVCTGAENVLLPHEEVDYQRIVEDVNRGVARGKESSIIIVAEGPKGGRSYEIGKSLKEKYKLDNHVAILGHIQRGGSPVATDRFIASQMGNLAVEALLEGKRAHVTVVRDGKTTIAPISECVTKQDYNFTEYKKLAQTLSI